MDYCFCNSFCIDYWSYLQPLLPNIYESKALLVPVNSSNSISGALGGYSSLAGLAGISLPSGGDEGNSVKAIKRLAL